MAGPTLTPPGSIEHHVTLMALTPALLAVGAAIATRIIGRGRLGRWCGWCMLAAALSVQALFLLPNGAAASYPQPVGCGLVRIGWVPTGLALLFGLWALMRWHPESSRQRPWSWCARVALALALPVTQVPLLVIGCEADVSLRATRRRSWRALVLVLATVAIPLVGPRVAMASGLAIAGLLLDGPWRPVTLVCALAQLAPP